MNEKEAAVLIKDLIEGCQVLEDQGIKRYGIKCSGNMIKALKIALKKLLKDDLCEQPLSWRRIHDFDAYECPYCKTIVCTHAIETHGFCHVCGKKVLV